ncbi:type 2 isopentenyl-diphosphate Delta-isomerase [Consotaella salsifontis]|uniref:Isopentenyl-diphosphate delta-isomerase n=1 Tax=Consotaella salsifontis TaxID=1365950 RepID=A0A1T4L854_9HYPH|nr:type 2 isopentenyl-diphosphate Delta-isomerase [Consotaella salsifontis]SJZ50912.1 isopentenyl-diphosphate delta-isomerase [Consotaella salsifontis]
MSSEENRARAPSGIAARKGDHLDIVLSASQSGARLPTGFEAVQFEHCALPELDFDKIDLSQDFLGRTLAAPLLISSMTGGPERAGRINHHLAEAAETLKIAFAVGSQRIAIEGHASCGLGKSLRRTAPSVPILANIGAAQLVAGYGVPEALRAIEMIEADGLIIHLNPLQEAVQTGGDRRWRGVLEAIAALRRELPVPLIVKEVGAGISGRVARRLTEIGVSIIDVAGAGGTSWAAVEAERAPDERRRDIAARFSDWGIPTAAAIREVREFCPDAFIIGSGGVRDGLDAAKALRLGADLVGQAASGLASAEQSAEAAIDHFSAVIEELRIACFCTGSKDLAALRQAPLLPSPASAAAPSLP